jgi:hypothetical protein
MVGPGYAPVEPNVACLNAGDRSNVGFQAAKTTDVEVRFGSIRADRLADLGCRKRSFECANRTVSNRTLDIAAMPRVDRRQSFKRVEGRLRVLLNWSHLALAGQHCLRFVQLSR